MDNGQNILRHRNLTKQPVNNDGPCDLDLARTEELIKDLVRALEIDG